MVLVILFLFCGCEIIKPEPNPSPVFESVYSGSGFAFAIKNNGELWGWGNVSNAMLGGGEIKSGKNITSPAKILDNISMIDINGSSLGYMAMAVAADGQLYTWGKPDFILFNNENMDMTRPIKPSKVMDNVNSVYGKGIIVGKYLIKKDNSLWTWDNSIYTDTEISSHDQIDNYRELKKIMESVVDICITPASVFALKSNGEVWGWGRDENGLLCKSYDSDTSIIYPPVLIMEDVRQLEKGLAVKRDGTLWEWGKRFDSVDVSPKQVADNIKCIAVRDNSYLALKNDGSLYKVEAGCWTKIMDDVTYIRAETGYFAIKKDGTLWGWGYNSNGQIVPGGDKMISEPKKLMEDVVYVVPNNYNTYALKRDGTLWGWGDNSYGQLGQGNTDIINNPVPILTDVRIPA
jgi:alpha-tubulin suppressor-like RCC1 family protein